MAVSLKINTVNTGRSVARAYKPHPEFDNSSLKRKKKKELFLSKSI